MQEFLENKTQFGPKIQAVYIWGGKPAVDLELLQSLPSLKIIASSGAGLDHLDQKLIASFGVKVANTPHAVSSPTADLGMALLLAAARRLVEGKWPLETLVFQRVRWQIFNNTRDKIISSSNHRSFSGPDFFPPSQGLCSTWDLEPLLVICHLFHAQAWCPGTCGPTVCLMAALFSPTRFRPSWNRQ